MTVSMILLIILIFFCILLFLPIQIRISYSEQISVSVGTFHIFWNIIPSPKKKPLKLSGFSYRNYQKQLKKEQEKQRKKDLKELEKQKKKHEKQKAKKTEKEKKLPPDSSVKEPSVIPILIHMIGDLLNRFAGKLHVTLIRMNIVVGGANASEIAMTYGILSQSIAYLLELISLKTRYRREKKADVVLRADFLLEKTKMDICFVFQICLADILGLGIHALFRFLKEKSQQSPQTSNQNV